MYYVSLKKSCQEFGKRISLAQKKPLFSGDLPKHSTFGHIREVCRSLKSFRDKSVQRLFFTHHRQYNIFNEIDLKILY